jgi:Type I phosphodiesterase / nucleotide pyrophosphatase
MRYLRMLTNAMAGGVLVAMYLVVLVLQLNPQVPVASMTAVRWFWALLALYGPYLSVAIYFLILLLELVASRPLRPAWFSVRLLAWLGSAGAALAALAMWANLRGFRAVLSEDAADRMRQGALATSVFAAVLLTIAALRYSVARRGSRVAAALLLLSMAGSVVVPVLLRGPGEVPVPPARRRVASRTSALPPRVHLLLLDGSDLGFIRQRVAAGQLPNFGKLLDWGALMDVATLKPTQAEPIWTSAATGKYPPKTGIRSNAVYRPTFDAALADPDPVDLLPDYCFAYALVDQGFVREERLSSGSRSARTLWDILTDYRLASGIVDWPLTYPAHADRGYVVSDEFDEAATSPLRLADAQAADPTTAVDIARETFDDWQLRPLPDLLPGLTAADPEPTGLARARWDHAYGDAAGELEIQFAPRLTAMRYEGIDWFGHTYLRDAQPELFGELRRTDPQRSVLDHYYVYLDSEVGRTMSQLAPGDLLIVMSGFGMAPTTMPKRLLARLLGQADRSGSHENAPDGFLIAFGSNVAHGQYPRGAIVDLAPTVLYYMGLDVGRDMDGFARTDLFLRNFTVEHPVTYVPTHETSVSTRER